MANKTTNRGSKSQARSPQIPQPSKDSQTVHDTTHSSPRPRHASFVRFRATVRCPLNYFPSKQASKQAPQKNVPFSFVLPSKWVAEETPDRHQVSRKGLSGAYRVSLLRVDLSRGLWYQLARLSRVILRDLPLLRVVGVRLLTLTWFLGVTRKLLGLDDFPCNPGENVFEPWPCLLTWHCYTLWAVQF